MDDGGVQPGLHALVQEDRVQHLAGGGLEAERDVGQSEGGLDARVTPLELGDRVDRLDPVPPGLLLAGGDREREAVEDDVLLAHPPVHGQVGDQPLGDLDLPRRGAGLAALVDGQRDHRRAVLADHRHQLGDPGVRAVAVLVVDRVDDRAAADQLEARLDHRGLGRVEHQRQRRGGAEPPGDLAHVGHAVPADVVDADVEQVGPVTGLRLGDRHAVLVVVGDHRLAERLRPVGVGPLADREERGVLAERHVAVEGRDPGLGAGVPRR